MSTFGEFVNKTARQAKKRLDLVEKVLVRERFVVRPHLDDTVEPYIYVANSNNRLSFGGVRVYITGESVAYRVQKDDKTHPYGKSYRLDIEEMYDDLVSDEEISEKKAAYMVIEALPKEIKMCLI